MFKKQSLTLGIMRDCVVGISPNPTVIKPMVMIIVSADINVMILNRTNDSFCEHADDYRSNGNMCIMYLNQYHG